MMTRVPAGIGAPVPAGSFEMLCPGPQAVSHGVPPFNDRAGPARVEPGLPEAGPPLAAVVLGLGRSGQIRRHGVGDLVVYLGAVGLEVDGGDERVVREVRVEQGAVVVVGATARGAFGLYAVGACKTMVVVFGPDCVSVAPAAELTLTRAMVTIVSAASAPEHDWDPESPRSLLAHGLRLPPGVRLRLVGGQSRAGSKRTAPT